MSNIKSHDLFSGLGLAAAALLAAFGLAACLGDGPSGSGAVASVDTVAESEETFQAPVTPIPPPSFPPPTPIPAAPVGASIAGLGAPGTTGIVVTTDTTGMQAGDAVQIDSTGGLYGACGTCYNGTFVISNVVASSAPGNFDGSFEVAITFTSPVAGATTQIVAGGTPPACSTQEVVAGDGAFIPTVSISASRYQGVAPLAVFFETAGTDSTLTTREFHELEYNWDFDVAVPTDVPPHAVVDPAIGNWGDKSTGSSGTGANTSRKTDSGPLAAHVYETAGTYRVKLTVRDAQGHAVTNNCVQIAVLDPDTAFAGQTACVSNDADFTGCPASVPGGARFTTSNFSTAMSNVPAYKRILFKRGAGQVYDAPTTAVITAAGPGMVGTFGSPADPAPRIRNTNTTSQLLFQIGGAAFSDWRIVDLELDLNSPTTGSSSNRPRAVESAGNISDLLLQRLWIHDGFQGLLIGTELPTAGLDKVFYVDLTFQNLMAHPTNGQAGWLSGYRLVWMGNKVDTTRSHNTRFPYLSKAVLSHNHHRIPGSTTSNMKVPGANNALYPGYFSERIVLANNRYESHSGDWMVELQPQHRNTDERIRDVVVEKNLFRSISPSFGPAAISVSGADITVRNNIFDLSYGGDSANSVTVGQFGNCNPYCEPPPTNVDVFHNTIYSSAGQLAIGSRSPFPVIQLRASKAGYPAMTGIRVQNNLAYAPNKTPPAPPIMVDGAALAAANTNNTLDAEVYTTAPAWTFSVSLPGLPGVPTPTNTSPDASASPPNDFKLTAPSYTLGDGTVPVMSDFFGNPRTKTTTPATNNNDIGAAEF